MSGKKDAQNLDEVMEYISLGTFSVIEAMQVHGMPQDVVDTAAIVLADVIKQAMADYGRLLVEGKIPPEEQLRRDEAGAIAAYKAAFGDKDKGK